MSTPEFDVLLWSVKEGRQDQVRVAAKIAEPGLLTEAPGRWTAFGGE